VSFQVLSSSSFLPSSAFLLPLLRPETKAKPKGLTPRPPLPLLGSLHPRPRADPSRPAVLERAQESSSTFWRQELPVALERERGRSAFLVHFKMIYKLNKLVGMHKRILTSSFPPSSFFFVLDLTLFPGFETLPNFWTRSSSASSL